MIIKKDPRMGAIPKDIEYYVSFIDAPTAREEGYKGLSHLAEKWGFGSLFEEDKSTTVSKSVNPNIVLYVGAGLTALVLFVALSSKKKKRKKKRKK